MRTVTAMPGTLAAAGVGAAVACPLAGPQTGPVPRPSPRFRHGQWEAAKLARTRGATTVSVCLPARDEARTVGAIVDRVRRELIERTGLVDEVLVLDDGSTDATADVAAAAGARVERVADLLPALGPGSGKGEALWKSVYAARGDIVVWCDADIANFDARFVVGLLGPLLSDPEIAFVKGFYDRPVDGQHGQGGRVTELMARPAVALLHPHLNGIVQPLSGEYAGRREVLEVVPFVQGYGVDLGLLIDVAARVGLHAMAQVDLGVRVHRNRPLEQLGPTALAVLQTALARAGSGASAPVPTLVRPGVDPVVLPHRERPPLASVAAYRIRHPRVERRERTA